MLDSRTRWAIENIDGKRILNLGFIGNGRDGIAINREIKARNKDSLVVGLDINQRLAFRLKEQNTIVGTVLDLPIKSQSINTVFLGEVVEHFFDITPLITEVSRVLKPKGKLCLTTPNVFMLFRWLQCWFLKDRKKIAASKNVRDFLSDRNHKVFWEPLSLVNILRQQSLKTIDITTKVIAIPYLSFWQDLDLPIWPFDRLGGSLCLIAEKQ